MRSFISDPPTSSMCAIHLSKHKEGSPLGGFTNSLQYLFYANTLLNLSLTPCNNLSTEGNMQTLST